MANHTKHTLVGLSILQIVDMSLTIATFEASATEGLIASKDGDILDLLLTGGTTISAIIAYKRTVAQ